MFDGSLPEPDELTHVSDAELATAVAGWAAASAAADARKLAAIAELARRACTDERRERQAIDGTAIAAAQVSCALSVTHGKAIGLVDLAATLRDRLPKVRARFLAGQISPAMIAAIAWRTFLVHQSALPAIDSEIAERAPTWGTLSDKKLEHAIDVWIDRHDPNAVRRTRNAMRGRNFAVGDRNDEACGTTSMHGRLSVTDAALVHQRLAIMIANPCPDDPRTMDNAALMPLELRLEQARSSWPADVPTPAARPRSTTDAPAASSSTSSPNTTRSTRNPTPTSAETAATASPLRNPSPPSRPSPGARQH